LKALFFRFCLAVISCRMSDVGPECIATVLPRDLTGDLPLSARLQVMLASADPGEEICGVAAGLGADGGMAASRSRSAAFFLRSRRIREVYVRRWLIFNTTP
jgi:hypothetical protein